MCIVSPQAVEQMVQERLTVFRFRCNRKFCSDDTILSNTIKLNKLITIKVAKSGSYLQANQTGELNVVSTVNGKKIPIIIRGVLLMQGLYYNLLYVKKLEMNGFKVLFADEKGTIMKKKLSNSYSDQK